MNAKRAWLYCSIDAPEDTHGTLKGQHEKLDSYARQMGFEVLDSSHDLSGGLEFDRTGLIEAADAAEAGKMDVLIIDSMSRIGRDIYKTLEFIRKLNSCGVKVYSPLEGEISTAYHNEISPHELK